MKHSSVEEVLTVVNRWQQLQCSHHSTNDTESIHSRTSHDMDKTRNQTHDQLLQY